MLKSKIKFPYIKHRSSRIYQGDILRDFIFYTVDVKGVVRRTTLPYVVILSQDCDLDACFKKKNSVLLKNEKIIEDNQFLPNILFCPAFVIDEVILGEHLIDAFKVKQGPISKFQKEKILQNKDERYHFLQKYSDLQIPELLIDFKLYFLTSRDYFKGTYKEYYLASVNELYREKLNQRFSNFIGRIGLPVFLENKTITPDT